MWALEGGDEKVPWKVGDAREQDVFAYLQEAQAVACDLQRLIQGFENLKWEARSRG